MALWKHFWKSFTGNGKGLFKPSCISTLAAEFLCRFLFGESVVDVLGSGSCQNGFHIVLKKIAQSQITFVIQAAGNCCNISENAELIPQSVTENPVTALRSGQIRPVEFIAVFQENPLTDPLTLTVIHPGGGEEFLHGV